MLNNLILKMSMGELSVPLNISEKNLFFLNILFEIRNTLGIEQCYK